MEQQIEQAGPTAWDVLSLGLGIGASGAAVVGALWGLWILARRGWDRTVGRRRAQAAILDQLACTVSQAYVENLLGAPKIIIGTQHFYELPGAWVGIEFKDAAVHILSITITDAKMWYRIGGITLGTFDVRLGVDTFAQLVTPVVKGDLHDGEELWRGLKEAGYWRHYHFGGAGGAHQHFWLSFNSVGAGTFDSNADPYMSGSAGRHGGTAPDATKITANTLAVLSPWGSVGDAGGGPPLAPHFETLSLTWAVRQRMQHDASRRVQRRRWRRILRLAADPRE